VHCWCGNSDLSQWGQGYLRCDQCQTLLTEFDPAQPVTRVTDDSADYYGKNYWFDHQTIDLGCPDIVSRSRTDLSERCVHWMACLLQFKLPPAKVLEIGCGHGGFVAMLRQAGFDAMGLELSPSIVKFASEIFAIDVLTGPIEDQDLPPQSLDAIVMMDVLEHLPSPVTTLKKCFDLLKPGGIMLLQTPAYPEGMTLQQISETGHKFAMMLDRNEHLHLFSKPSVRSLLHRVGVSDIEFIPAMFPLYDMSLVAGAAPLRQFDPEVQSAALCQTTSGRFIEALLDLDARRNTLLGKFRQMRDQMQLQPA
jgi:2-polyprenyl-3-methyl-5-hydroxy-6-metoxy-1,4-benzoquinol methylase